VQAANGKLQPEQDIQRIAVSVPPQHGKSTLVAEGFVPWYVGTFNAHAIVTAHGDSLARKFGRSARNVFEEHGETLWGSRARLVGGVESQNEWELVGGGGVLATGLGGSVTGRGARLVVIDDPHKGVDDSHSEIMQENVYDAFRGVTTTRLAPRGIIVVIHTRWAEGDLIGPRHLSGAIPFFVLNVVDVARHAAGCELQLSKADAPTANALIAVWGRLGIPLRLKLDNWLVPTNNRRLPVVVRVCLDLGATAVFIPFAEPWRNPVVEHFNDTFDKHFFRSERFRDRAHLRRRMRPFERFHNAHHRYSALKGATPDEVTRRLGFRPRLLDPAYRIPARPPRRGTVEFIRLIRSDRLLRVMDARIELPEGLVYEYVTAVLDVGREKLDVLHQGRHVKSLPFALEG